MPNAWAAARQVAMETPRMALAPSLDCSPFHPDRSSVGPGYLVHSLHLPDFRSNNFLHIPHGLCTPCPRNASGRHPQFQCFPLSGGSPDGTAALPFAPPDRWTSTSTVGSRANPESPGPLPQQFSSFRSPLSVFTTLPARK